MHGTPGNTPRVYGMFGSDDRAQQFTFQKADVKVNRNGMRLFCYDTTL